MEDVEAAAPDTKKPAPEPKKPDPEIKRLKQSIPVSVLLPKCL